MMTGAGTTFQDGLIRKELQDKFEAAFHAGIDTCAAVGCPNLIAMPGERRGMSREESIDNAVAILSRVKGYAEQKERHALHGMYQLQGRRRINGPIRCSIIWRGVSTFCTISIRRA